MGKYEIPVVLFVFKRLETVQLILDKIRIIKPKYFYVFSDGARSNVAGEREKVEQVRDFISHSIDWECEFEMRKAPSNLGYAINIQDGFNSTLKKHPYAIFLEDDAIPSLEFFQYAKELLAKYKDEDRIQYVAGFNGIGDTELIPNSYGFGKSVPMSGAIATWADRWNNCDFSMQSWDRKKRAKEFAKYSYFRELRKQAFNSYDRIKGNGQTEWDVQFGYDLLDKNRVAVVPRQNLAKSFGNIEATHYQENKSAIRMSKHMDFSDTPFEFPMDEPKEIVCNIEYDKMRQKIFLEVNGNYLQRHWKYILHWIKDLAYSILPPTLWNLIKKIIKKEK